jgi:hypothetical protein
VRPTSGHAQPLPARPARPCLAHAPPPYVAGAERGGAAAAQARPSPRA